MAQVGLFVWLWFLIINSHLSNALTSNQSIMDEFSDIVSAKLSVTIDPLEVIYDNINETSPTAFCSLSIHRDNCLNPKIRANETILWHTRICFKWTCENTTTHVMRIESCWTGSSHRPIILIDNKGCTRHREMVSTPRYENSLLAAYSVGYLSVRLVGADRIRFSCTVRLCHVCHSQCPAITPPRKCLDSERLSTYLFTRWNNTEELEKRCKPEEYRKRHAKSISTRQKSQTLSQILTSLFLFFMFGKFTCPS